MPREFRLYLQDIVDAALFIESSSSGLDYDSFINDAIRLNAILYSLTIIGEAVKNIPDEIRVRAPDIPWKEIAGTRDFLVHGYFAVNLPIIWHAVANEVPVLRQRIEQLLHELDQP